jgi:hypothetical protein
MKKQANSTIPGYEAAIVFGAVLFLTLGGMGLSAGGLFAGAIGAPLAVTGIVLLLHFIAVRRAKSRDQKQT